MTVKVCAYIIICNLHFSLVLLSCLYIYDLPKVVSNSRDQRIRTAIAHTLQKSEPHIYIYIYIPMEVPSTIRVKRRRDDNPVQALGMYILTCTH